MKLYLNCNYSGYHWFEADDICGKTGNVSFQEPYGKPSCKTISYLRSYVEHCPYLLMNSVENGEHVAIMMIGSIEESRTDEMGRRIKMFAIFTGCHEDLPLMHKILLYSMTDKKGFDERFVSNIILGSSLECDASGLNSLIDDAAKGEVLPSKFSVPSFAKKDETKVYVLVSNKKDDTLAQDLLLPKSELACKVGTDEAEGRWISLGGITVETPETVPEPDPVPEPVPDPEPKPDPESAGENVLDVLPAHEGLLEKLLSWIKAKWQALSKYFTAFIVGFILGAILL